MIIGVMGKVVFRTLLAVIIFLTISAAYFYPYLEGKRVVQGDLIQYLGMSQEISRFESEIGRRPLWTDAMFGGMPAFQINTPHNGNYLQGLHRILILGKENPIGFFFLAMLGMFILLVLLQVDFSLAIIGGFAFGLATNNMILYEAGHISKLKAIIYLPLVTSGLLLIYRRNYWWGFFLFSIGLGLNLLANHLQMTYYFFLTLPILLIIVWMEARRSNAISHFLKASALIGGGFILAIGSSVSNLWTTYEYSKETIRGNSILTTPADEFVDSTFRAGKTTGLDWNYAMEWSNGSLDLLACIIPGAAGNSSDSRLFPGSKLSNDLSSQGITDLKRIKAPMYWGDLPFTNGPTYFGIIIFSFFLIGLFTFEGPLKWWLGVGTLFAVLLSLGQNFEWFNRFFFNYVPFYNKFRTPNSILSVVSFMMPFFGILALHRLLKESAFEANWPIVRKLILRLGLLILILAALGPYVFSFSGPHDLQFEAGGLNIEYLIEDRKSLFRWDAFRSLFLLSLSFLLLWIYLRKYLNRQIIVLGLGILIFFDYWTIDRRFISPSDFQTERKYDELFKPRPVDQQILSDPDPNFRVLDWTINTFNSASSSYFHKTLGGYHAAKLRRYQDVIDRYLIHGDRGVINMLNTKYVIQPATDGNPAILTNEERLGNAWAVDSLLLVNSPEEEIAALDHLDPAQIAVMHREFSSYLEGLDPVKAGEISLVNYVPDHLIYQSKCDGEMLAVFSEIWYGPEKGWYAYIDGRPAPILRANYLLRALRLPAGSHRIEFVFQPKSFYTGRIISRISSAFILYGFLWFMGVTLIGRVSSYQVARTRKRRKPLKVLETPDLIFPASATKEPVGTDVVYAPEEMVPGRPEVSPIQIATAAETSGKLTRVFRMLAGSVLILMLGLAWRSGINADDEFQFDYSQKLVNYYTSFGKDTSAIFIPKGNMHLYGGFFELTTGLVNRMLGFSQIDVGYHRVRHLFIALAGFLAIWFASLLAIRIGGIKAGILAMIFMFLSPRFLGHAMMNPKDIPFAAGYMMAIFYMVKIFEGMPKVDWRSAVGMILGMGLAIGTRAGGLLLIGYLLVFACLDFVRKRKNENFGYEKIKEYSLTVASISIGGYLLAILFWPAALVDPLHLPFNALTKFSDLNVFIKLLYKGDNVMSDQVERMYALTWIWKTLPIFSIIGIVGSILSLNFMMHRFSKFPVLLICVAALFPIFYVIYQDSVLHDGWRHLLFVYPPMVVLVALFWSGILEYLKGKKLVLYSTYVLLIYSCLESGIFIARNSPFPYIYFNSLNGGIRSAYGNFETDYWGVGVRQAIKYLEAKKILDETMSDTITIATSNFYNVYWQLDEKYRHKVKVNYLGYADRYKQDWDYGIFYSRFVPGRQLRSGHWPSDEVIGTIRSGNVPLIAILQDKGIDIVRKGIEALTNQNWDTADSILQEALLLKPENENVLRSLALTKFYLLDYQEAINLAERSMQITGPNPEAYGIIGLSQKGLGNLVSAKQALFKAISLERNFATAHLHLATIYFAEGNYQTALERAMITIQTDPGFVEAYALVADIYMKLGDEQKSQYYRNQWENFRNK